MQSMMSVIQPTTFTSRGAFQALLADMPGRFVSRRGRTDSIESIETLSDGEIEEFDIEEEFDFMPHVRMVYNDPRDEDPVLYKNVRFMDEDPQ